MIINSWVKQNAEEFISAFLSKFAHEFKFTAMLLQKDVKIAMSNKNNSLALSCKNYLENFRTLD